MKNLVLIALLIAALPAAAQSRRAGTTELFIGPVFTDGKNYSFDSGSSARTDTGFGINFGFAHNFNSHWSAGMEIEWTDQDYRASVAPGPGNTLGVQSINGTLESRTLRFTGNYNFSAREFTPFVNGGLGWTYIDTNIPSGLPENFCWYYPWWGGYCTTYVPTHATTRFSYNFGAGLRYDYGRGLFRFMVNSQWVDFGSGYSSNAIQYRIDFGSKF